MSTITGTWHVRRKTSVGTFDADNRFAQTPDGITVTGDTLTGYSRAGLPRGRVTGERADA